jgi:hypothetical protein
MGRVVWATDQFRSFDQYKTAGDAQSPDGR